MVERRTENPCVGSSILPLATILRREAENALRSFSEVGQVLRVDKV